MGSPMPPPFRNIVPFPSPSHPSSWSQSRCLSSLSHTANSFWLSILHVVCNRWLTNNRHLLLSFGGWEFHDQDRAGGWWMVVFSLCPQRAQGVSHLSGVSFIKAFIPPRRVPPSLPNYLPKALSHNTIPLVY